MSAIGDRRSVSNRTKQLPFSPKHFTPLLPTSTITTICVSFFCSLSQIIMFWNLVDKSKLIDSYGIKHIALVVMLGAFSLLGGFTFCSLEAPNEIRIRDEIRQRYELVGGWAKSNLSTRLRVLFDDDTLGAMYRERLIDYAMRDYDRSMGVDSGDTIANKWNLWGGIYYSFTLYTTIGYGDISCATTAGRMVTLVYAIFGVPLTITILNDWGRLLFTVVRNIWRVKMRNSINFMLTCVRSVCGQRRETITTSINEDFDDEQQSIPLKLAVFLLLFWVIVCASIFCLFEEWTIFDSIYFFFISLTTIGLGDVTPRHSVVVMNALLILIGLSVVSMSIHVIQMKLEHIFNRIVMSIDSDFKKSLENEEKRRAIMMRDSVRPGDEDMDVTAAISSVERYGAKMKGTDRLLLKLMSSHQRHLLDRRYDERANMRNRSTQTSWHSTHISVQTEDNIRKLTSCSDRDTVMNGDLTSSLSRFNNKRMYIYNIDD